MREKPVSISVFAQQGALAKEIAAAAEQAAHITVASSGSDLATLLAAAVDLRSVLVAEAELLLETAMHDERITTMAHVPVVGIYQAVTDGAIRLAMRFGVRGLVSREALPTRFAESITRVADGEIFLDGPALQQLLHAGVGGRLAAADADRERYRLLSNREAEIFVRLARGMNSRAIARELGISVKTVETHQSHVYQKLGVGSAVELFHIALRLGIEEMNGV